MLSVKRCDRCDGKKGFLDKGWKSDHFVLSTFKDNLFALNYVAIFFSSVFILTTGVLIFL